MMTSIQSNAAMVQTALSQPSAQPKETKTEKAKEISKVDAIKEAIARGEYKVDIAQTAEAMASDLL